MDRDGPTFRDLYEVAERVDGKLDDLNEKFVAHDREDTRRFNRVTTAVIVLGIVAASPKVGGPGAADLLAVLRTFLA